MSLVHVNDGVSFLTKCMRVGIILSETTIESSLLILIVLTHFFLLLLRCRGLD